MGPGAGEGEEMAGAVSGRAIPRGASGPVLGRGEQLGGVMKEETPATWGRAATGSWSAGAFQGNMAGGGGGFSPEAQCGAAAVESHKGVVAEYKLICGMWDLVPSPPGIKPVSLHSKADS